MLIQLSSVLEQEYNAMVVNNVLLRELPNRENHHCFGCSQYNEYGLRMRFFTDDKIVYSDVRVPGYMCGWNNIVHGGIISTMTDEVMSWTAMHLLRRIILTRTMTVEFMKPILIETNVRLQGEVLEKVSDREAIIEGRLYNQDNELCARSKGVFALFTADAMRRMKLLPVEVIDQLQKIVDEC